MGTLTLMAFCALICFYPKAGGVKPKHEIVEITDDYFELKVRKFDLALIMYYAPWCGHCLQLKPHFESASKKLAEEDPPVVFAKVDCTDRGKITCARFGVRSFPVLKIFKDGGYYDEFNDTRDEGGIVRTMAALARPEPKKLASRESLDNFRNYYESVVIGFFPSKSKLKDIFLQISDELRAKIRFGITENHALSKQFEVTDGLAILRPPDQHNEFEPDLIKYNGGNDEQEIQNWISNNLHSLVEVRTRVNKLEFKRPLVVVYCDIDVDIIGEPKTKLWRNKVLSIANKFKSFQFAVSSVDNFAEEFQDFGIEYDKETTKMPIVTVKTEKGMKYAMKEEFSPENLEQFLNQILNNEINPYIKSQPIPEKNDEPVKIAVGKNFDEIVTNNGKDTFIEFYAPWCYHCKQLAPIWKKIGDRMKDEEVEIVKMDVTENDVFPPYEIAGHPTLYWAGKDSKNNPEKFLGRRSVKEIIKFIASRSSTELKKYDRSGERKDKKLNIEEKGENMKEETRFSKQEL